MTVFALIEHRQRLEFAERVRFSGTGLFQKVENVPCFVELPGIHQHRCDAQTRAGELWVKLIRLAIEWDGIFSRVIVELSGEANEQFGVSQKLSDDLRSECRGFGILMERQQISVCRQRGRSRRFLLKDGRGLDHNLLARRRILVGTHHVVIAAGCTGIDNPLPSQRDQWDEQNHEPQSRVIRFKKDVTLATRADSRPRLYVRRAAVHRPDAVERCWHFESLPPKPCVRCPVPKISFSGSPPLLMLWADVLLFARGKGWRRSLADQVSEES